MPSGIPSLERPSYFSLALLHARVRNPNALAQLRGARAGACRLVIPTSACDFASLRSHQWT
eukprot:4942427-Pyramimonas_sp.AAC.1